MIRFISEIGLFIFCLTGVILGNKGYCILDLISYSFFGFLITTILGIVLVATVGRENSGKNSGTSSEMIAGEVQGQTPVVAAPAQGFSILQ